MEFKCIAEKTNPKNIVLFGRVIPIESKTPARLDMYCIAKDQNGKTYDIYTDYDPCVGVSRTVAIKREA